MLGMLISPDKKTVTATSVRFDHNLLYVALSDGREISILLDAVYWLAWLHRATDEQRANWSIEPGGFAVYWQELDDGIELCHLLSLEALS
jgi:hypothetical protein